MWGNSLENDRDTLLFYVFSVFKHNERSPFNENAHHHIFTEKRFVISVNKKVVIATNNSHTSCNIHFLIRCYQIWIPHLKQNTQSVHKYYLYLEAVATRKHVIKNWRKWLKLKNIIIACAWALHNQEWLLYWDNDASKL